MTTTPTIWKATFYPNFDGEPGNQSAPQTIALPNDRFLTVWQDDTNGPGAFTDIMGRIFTPDGGPAGAAFQVNSAFTASDETEPKVVALPDGGYVVAYGSYLDTLGGFIGVE